MLKYSRAPNQTCLAATQILKHSIILITLFTSSLVFSDDFKVRLLPRSGPPIPSLIFSETNGAQDLLLQVDKSGRPYVSLQGAFAAKDRVLLFSLKRIRIDANHKFILRIPITGRQTRFSVQSIDPYGTIQTENRILLFSDWPLFQERLAGKRKPASVSKNWYMTPGLGWTYLTLHQGSVDFSEIVMMAKLTAGVLLSPDWNLGGSAFLTAFPIQSDPVNTYLQVFGCSARIGYRFIRSSSFELIGMWGWYFNTSFPSASGFGYNNVQGPQLFPVARITIGGSWASFYLKYSPLFGGGTSISLSNAEVAIGGSYPVLQFDSQHEIAITLDVAHLTLQPATSSSLASDSYSFGASYKF